MFLVRHFIRLYLVSFCFSSLLCQGEQENEMVLDGYTGEGRVSLLWTAHGWPEQVVGFKVKRRELGSGTWASLSQHPICPEVSLERNWDDQGLDQKQEKAYRSKLEAFLTEGVFKQISREEFLAQLEKVGMRTGDRIRIKENFDLALVLGFGFIDSTVNDRIDYEYGLFAVYKGGNESADPLDTYTTIRLAADDVRIKVGLWAEQQGAYICLSWVSGRELHEQLGFMSYNVYRRKTESDEWVPIRGSGLGPREKLEDSLKWVYLDQKSDPFKSWYFAVAPVNKFQTEFEKSIVKYEPKEWCPAEVISVEIDGNTRVRVSWEMDETAEMLCQGYHLERSATDVTNFVRLTAEMISPGSRAVLDQKPLPYTELLYRVVTVDKEGAEFASSPQLIFYKDPRGSDPAQDFYLTFYQTNGESFVRGDWVEGTNNVARYKVCDDASFNRHLAERSYVKLGPTNSYTWALGNASGGREYTFGIQPVSEDRVAGPRELKSIYISTLKPSAMQKQYATLLGDGNILLSWEYPDVKDIVGFRILMDGVPVVMESEVPPSTRSWIIRDYRDTHEKNYSIAFEVQAVFPLCISKPLQSARIQMRKDRPDRSVPALDSFHARILGTYKGARWAYLSFGYTYLDPGISERLKGYIISASTDKDDFTTAKVMHLKRCRYYYFPIPEDFDGKAVYFRCAAEGELPCGGLFKRSAVSLCPKKWENKEISDDKYQKIEENILRHTIGQKEQGSESNGTSLSIL